LPKLLKKITIFHGGLPVGDNRRLKLENCDERFSLIGRPPSSFNNYWDTSDLSQASIINN